MQNQIKWVFAGAGLAILLGLILVFCGRLMGAKNGFILSTDGLNSLRVIEPGEEQFIEESTEPFHSILVRTDCYSINFMPSDHYGVDFSQDSAYPAAFSVQDGMLSFASAHKRQKDISIGLPTIGKDLYTLRVYYPADAEFDAIKIEADMGDINLKECNVRKLEADLDMGDLRLDGVQATDCELSVDLGDVTVLSPLPESAYNSECEIDLGEINVNGVEMAREYKRYHPGAACKLEIEVDAGDIKLQFAQ